MTTDRDVVLVTGTSSGIGRASVRALARAGCAVFAGVRRPESLPELEQEDGDVRPLLMDVTDDGSIDAARRAVDGALAGRPLRAIVNNAGVSLAGPLELVERAGLERVLRVNLLAPLWVTRAFLPLLEKPGGRIVNIGSGEGFIVLPINGAYAIAKHGLEALSDVLRLELAPSGRFVSVVVPGGVSTPILERSLARFEALLEEEGPMSVSREQIRGRQRIAERGLAGRGPESTAARVVAAVKARRPKAHYFVSWDAWLPAIIARLPTRLRDPLLRRAVS